MTPFGRALWKWIKIVLAIFFVLFLILFGVAHYFAYIHEGLEFNEQVWFEKRLTYQGQCDEVRSRQDHFCFDESRILSGITQRNNEPLFYTGYFVPSMYEDRDNFFDQTVYIGWEESDWSRAHAHQWALTRTIHDLNPEENRIGRGLVLDPNIASVEALANALAEHGYHSQATPQYQYWQLPYGPANGGRPHRPHMLLIYDGEVFITVNYDLVEDNGNVLFSTNQINYFGDFSLLEGQGLYDERPNVGEIYQIVREFLDFVEASRVTPKEE